MEVSGVAKRLHDDIHEFFGRRGVFELLKVSEEMREVMLKSPTMGDIQKSLAGTKFVKLSTSGYLLVAQGVTYRCSSTPAANSADIM